MPVSQAAQKWILTFFMFLNGFITPGGIIYGWPGFTQLLKDEGEYSDGCPNYDPKKTCGDQDNKLNTIFTIGTNLATVSTIVYGITLDRYGVRANAVSAGCLMTGGFILMAYSETQGDHPFDAFIPGFSMIAFGGLGTYLPAFQFSALFARPTLILSIQSALFGAAGLTFTFFKYLAQSHGISRKTSFLAYSIATGFCTLSMLLLYPKDAYKRGDPIHLPVLSWLGIQKAPTAPLDAQVNASSTDYSPLAEDDTNSKMDMLAKEHTDDALITTSMPNQTVGSIDFSPAEVEMLKQERLLRDLSPAEKTAVLNSRSLKEEILDPGTWLVAMHFSIGLLCCNLVNANISSVLKTMGDTDGKFADAFVFITSLYPIGFSLTIDTLQRRFRYAGTSFLATAGIMAGIAFLFIDNLYAQLPGFFIFSTGRALLITVMFSYASVEYRAEHYGRVVAFITAICAAIGVSQLGLQALLNGAADNQFDYFTAGMLIALAPLFYFSYWCHTKRV